MTTRKRQGQRHSRLESSSSCKLPSAEHLPDRFLLHVPIQVPVTTALFIRLVADQVVDDSLVDSFTGWNRDVTFGGQHSHTKDSCTTALEPHAIFCNSSAVGGYFSALSVKHETVDGRL